MKKYAFTLLKKKVFALLAAAMLAGGALVATSAIAPVAVHAEQPVETNGYYQEYPLNKIVTIARRLAAKSILIQRSLNRSRVRFYPRAAGGKQLAKSSLWPRPITSPIVSAASNISIALTSLHRLTVASLPSMSPIIPAGELRFITTSSNHYAF